MKERDGSVGGPVLEKITMIMMSNSFFARLLYPIPLFGGLFTFLGTQERREKCIELIEAWREHISKNPDESKRHTWYP